MLIAKKTEADLKRFYPRKGRCPILYLGLDHARFNPAKCSGLREAARASLNLAPREFVLLLIGNDLIKKGILALFEALARLGDLPIQLLVVSRETSGVYQPILSEKGLAERVSFLPPRRDVEFYFAAADLYVGPSLEDTFAMPPEEAMACGLAVIASLANGISEVIVHGENGLILNDARDSESLAAMIRQVWDQGSLRAALGAGATASVQQFTWERNAQDLRAVFDFVLRQKGDSSRVDNALEHD